VRSNTETNESTVGLAIETSGGIGSVAIGRGGTVLGARRFDARNNHAVELVPSIDRLAQEHDLAARDIGHIYLSAGPGSFTGLRIGATFARALAFAVGARIVRVPTLTVIAQNALSLDVPPQRVVALLDAKRKHVFAACFEFADGAYAPIDEPAEREPVQYLNSLGKVTVWGEGVERHRDGIAGCERAVMPEGAEHDADPKVVYALGWRAAVRGEFTDARECTPVYVRRPEAEERWEKRNDDAGTATST
jgi:tRNA threonylcarbamoyladenosine biosynthesis protein TsaB